jgi:hypothetical protein
MVIFLYNEFEPLLIESKVLTKCFDKMFENWDLLISVGILAFVYNGYVNECLQLNIHHFSFALHNMLNYQTNSRHKHTKPFKNCCH